jgi:hypothetical protein
MPDVDICRENQFEFIFSTQDKILLEKQIGAAYTEILLRNITSQYSFKTTAVQETKVDTTKLDSFEYANIIEDKKYKTEPIFLNDDELFDVEYQYQKNIDAFKLINFNSKDKFVLRYLPEIYDEYKALIYFKTTQTTKIVDIMFDTAKIEKIFEEKTEKVDLAKMDKLLQSLST